MLNAIDAVRECLPPGCEIDGILGDGQGWFECEVVGVPDTDVLVQTEGPKVTVMWDNCYDRDGRTSCHEREVDLADPDSFGKLRKILREALGV